MEKKVKRNLQYTVQNLGEEYRIYIRTTKDEEFELCSAYPVEEVPYSDGSGTVRIISAKFADKIMELVNQGYKQVL